MRVAICCHSQRKGIVYCYLCKQHQSCPCTGLVTIPSLQTHKENFRDRRFYGIGPFVGGRYACSKCPLTVFISFNGLSRSGKCPTLTQRQDDAAGATRIHERDATALLSGMWIRPPGYPFSHLSESHRYYIVVLNKLTERHSDPLRLRATDEQADEQAD